jgi:hypothetical protein
MLDFKRNAFGDRRRPTEPGFLAFIGVHDAGEGPSIARGRQRYAGVVDPTAVEIVDGTIGSRSPDELRHRIGDRREGVARFERLLKLLKNRHVVLQSYWQREKTPPWFGYRADERRFGVGIVIAFLWLALAWAACERPATARSYDESSTSCAVSYDGKIWYRVPAGTFSPIDARFTQCGSFALARSFDVGPPCGAVPNGPTRAYFVAVSLQQRYSISGMLAMERIASRYSIPVTWMLGDLWWLGLDQYYNRFHSSNGDDVEAEYFASLHQRMRVSMPWYVPSVSVAGAGEERDLQRAAAFGERAFWGIAWNSDGTDGTFDRGAPWGAYCADPRSYKRPDTANSCREVAFEWTARDLTRAYLSGREDWFSTDPDDLQRAGISVADARRYMRELIDAYAAAGQSQPLVIVSQQESGEATNAGDEAIVDALYGQATAVGMHALTLRAAATEARRFAGRPRAVAFPSLPFGPQTPSTVLEGDSLYPATIDYHDRSIAATFLAGHTLPSRLFDYSSQSQSAFDRPLRAVPPAMLPRLLAAKFKDGSMVLTLDSPRKLQYAIALWSDPSRLRIYRRASIAAGRAGIVIPLSLRRGVQAVVVRCAGCGTSVLPYST